MEPTANWQHLGASEVILGGILLEKLQSLEAKEGRFKPTKS